MESKILMNRLNGGRSFSNGCGYSLDGATARIAGRKDSRAACLEIMRRPICFPFVADIGTCQHKPILIERDTVAKPAGIGLGPKKKENVPDRLVFDLPLSIPLYSL
jgi:hypothetical protein